VFTDAIVDDTTLDPDVFVVVDVNTANPVPVPLPTVRVGPFTDAELQKEIDCG
jgi:hypothetical protein